MAKRFGSKTTLNKFERECIKYLRNQDYDIEVLGKNRGHLRILVDDYIKISIASTPRCAEFALKYIIGRIERRKNRQWNLAA